MVKTTPDHDHEILYKSCSYISLWLPLIFIVICTFADVSSYIMLLNKVNYGVEYLSNCLSSQRLSYYNASMLIGYMMGGDG